jgi:hypothetical protein
MESQLVIGDRVGPLPIGGGSGPRWDGTRVPSSPAVPPNPLRESGYVVPCLDLVHDAMAANLPEQVARIQGETVCSGLLQREPHRRGRLLRRDQAYRPALGSSDLNCATPAATHGSATRRKTANAVCSLGVPFSVPLSLCVRRRAARPAAFRAHRSLHQFGMQQMLEARLSA